MSSLQKRVRARKMSSKMLALRGRMWPKLDVSLLWSRTEKQGFSTIPRTLPLILHIMDLLAPKGKPVSRVYLSLWCRVFDESVVVISNVSELAFEADFGGQRAVTTWSSRMKSLVELGFIDAAEGVSGKYNYILLYNPYGVIKKLFKAGKISEKDYNILFVRAQEIGATDLS